MTQQLRRIPSTSVILHSICSHRIQGNIGSFHLFEADAEAFKRAIRRLLRYDIALTRVINPPSLLRLEGVAVIAGGMWDKMSLELCTTGRL